jgi:hypothetical protein
MGLLGSGTCVNKTGETIAVYHSPAPGTGFDTALFRLPDGRSTPGDWDCDGIYVPADRSVLLDGVTVVAGPLAIKYGDRRTFTITKMGSIYVLPGKPKFEAVYVPHQTSCPTEYPLGFLLATPTAICWPIPPLVQAATEGLRPV